MQETLSGRLRVEHLVWAVILFTGITSAATPRRTYDVWWHLAAGRYIVTEREIPHEDPFTYTREGEEWTAHEWAWEVPMFLVFDRWGHAGLLGLRLVLGALIAGMLTWLLLKRGATPLAAIAAGALAILAARPLLNDRPQNVTTVLFLAMICLIEMSRQGRHRWLYAAPFLMVVWVNVHGGFVYGMGLLGLYALCCIPRWLQQRTAGEALRPGPTFLALVIVLSLAACVLNPNGLAGMAYPLRYVVGEYAWYQTVVQEYKSPDFSNAAFTLLALMIVGAAVIFAASRQGAGAWDLALLAIFLFTALKWRRNTALFAMAVAPLMALQLTAILRSVGLDSLGRSDGRQPSQLVLAAIIGTLTIAAVVFVPGALGNVEKVFSEDMPDECVAYIEHEQLSGRMFNTYRWGGYLMWRLYPEHQVFIDGRADVMGRPLMEDYKTATELKDGWRDVLERYEIDWVLISSNMALCRGLELLPQWRLAYEEEDARLYVRAEG